MTLRTDLHLAKWPDENLEHIGACPLCKSDRRIQFASNMHDDVFVVAPGSWEMWRCDECASLYLDPRPDEKSINLAYGTYYTHETSAHKPTLTQEISSSLKDFYRNLIYGSWAEYALSRMAPNQINKHSHSMRHLPIARRQALRLLDVGCGNGEFLHTAKQLGYEPFGLEPDRKAAHEAQKTGFSISISGLPGSALPHASFNQITAKHVLEHLLQPDDALREIYHLLEPGGRVWLTQPNPLAYSLKIFGKDWRGLEVPRHISIPSEIAIRRVLSNIGFHKIEILKPDISTANFYSESSLRSDIQKLGFRNLEECIKDIKTLVTKRPSLSDELTIVAQKPPEG